jgi:hypothetical protein
MFNETTRWQKLKENPHKTLQNNVSIWARHCMSYNVERAELPLLSIINMFFKQI